MIFDGFGDSFYLLNLTANCPAVPLLETDFSLLASGCEIDILEGQLDQIGPGRFQAIAAEPDQGLVLFCGQIFGILQKGIAAAFHHLGIDLGFFRSHLTQGIIHVLDQMKGVKGNFGIGQGFGDPFYKCL
jgi:hypothetical protein